jgi:phosphoribosylanthranilate isomerase
MKPDRQPVEVKICGLANRDDAQHALDCGADYLGFVLYPKSPRGITPKQLRRILDGLRGTARAVGVFVNEPPAAVRATARECGLFAVQIHGDETPDGFEDLGVTLWRAVRRDARGWSPPPACWHAERYVVDASVPGKYGGTGVAGDWRKAKELAEKCRVMLAGGLTPENVAEAIRAIRPAGVDVASGVEASPGKKDPEKVRRFIEAAKHTQE